MRRYLKLLKILVRVSFIRALMFRAAFYMDIAYSFIWLGLFFIIIQILFSHTEEIAGWSRANLIVLLGVWSFLDDLGAGTFWDGIKRLPDLVADGAMDFILARPVDSQFLIAAERFRFSRVLVILADVGLIAYGLTIGEMAPWHTIILRFPVLVVSGYIIALSVVYLLHTLGFWFLRINNVWALYDGLEGIAKYPLDVFGRHIKLLSLTIVPLTVMFMFPAQALLGRITTLEVLYAPVVAAIFFAVARWFYQYSVRRYSSVA